MRDGWLMQNAVGSAGMIMERISGACGSGHDRADGCDQSRFVG